MERLEIFNQQRSLLFAIAYRMLGSVSDAEDIIQEAWIRWQKSETNVQAPKAFLSQVVTRLCIDHLRSARSKREQYVGSWLPEPLITEPDVKDSAELAESLSFAFLVLLECLSPVERAVFLLHEVFDYNYNEIAKIVGKSAPRCRQVAHRTRQHLALRSPKIAVDPHRNDALLEQFLAHWNQGNLQGLMALLSEDITFWSDGGGKAIAAERPLQGSTKVARFLVAIRRSRLIPAIVSQMVVINGQLGIVNWVSKRPHSVFSFDIADDQIQSIFSVVNPEKLKFVNLHLH
jgi:RNA polymerase sigma-70 factor, ECF subfamily